jgi:hypothetical protein
MAFGDFFYYTLLKHSGIIIAVLGTIVAILVLMYMQKFGMGLKTTTENSISTCKEDFDCFEHCGKCVSIASQKICDPNLTISCGCIESKCKIA